MRAAPWPQVALGDIGRWFGGGTPSKARADYWTSGDIPWLSPKDMRADVLSGTIDRITTLAVEQSAVQLLPAGSVAIVVRSGILERTMPAAEVPFATTLNQDMKAIVPRSDVDLRYLRLAIQGVVAPQLARLRRSGTTVASIDTKSLLATRLPVPPLDEQHHIVAVLEDHLSRLDAAAAYLSAAQERSIAMASAQVVGVLFAGASDPSFVRRVVVDDAGALPPLPPDWRWRRLGEIADVVGGVTKDAGKQHAADFVEVPYLRVANVQRGHLNVADVKTIRVPAAKAAGLQLQQGDVLMNEGGDRDKLGRGWVWSGEINDCIHQNHVFRARVRDGVLRPKLLSWWANTVGGEWCERHGRQSVNLASISLSRIRQMPVPIPPEAEQAALEERIDAAQDAATRLRSAASASSARGARLRDGLLTAAFSGDL